jgi:hypothetical protein
MAWGCCGCGSVVECLASICKGLGTIPPLKEHIALSTDIQPEMVEDGEEDIIWRYGAEV